MQNNWSCITESDDFLFKYKSIAKIPKGDMLVTGEVVGLYPGTSHGADLEALRKRLIKRPTEDIVRMVDFVAIFFFFFLNSAAMSSGKFRKSY